MVVLQSSGKCVVLLRWMILSAALQVAGCVFGACVWLDSNSKWARASNSSPQVAVRKLEI